MDNSAKNEILAAIENVNVKIDIMQEQVAKIPEMQREIAKIPEMQQAIVEIQHNVVEMQKEVAKIPEMQQDIVEIQHNIVEMQKEIEKIPEIQQDIRNINRSVAVIEHEHGDKLRALFDAFAINAEKIETQKERISFCEKKLENHDAEIDYLANKVQGL